MYAIAFDLVIGDLKRHYGEPYNNAYFEVKTVLKKLGLNGRKGVFMSLYPLKITLPKFTKPSIRSPKLIGSKIG